MHVVLSCKVGRATAQPIGSFDVTKERTLDDAKATAAALQNDHLAALLRSGVAADRIKFETAVIGAPKAARKGKR